MPCVAPYGGALHYAGLDLHKKNFTLWILTNDGHVVADHRRRGVYELGARRVGLVTIVMAGCCDFRLARHDQRMDQPRPEPGRRGASTGFEVYGGGRRPRRSSAVR